MVGTAAVADAVTSVPGDPQMSHRRSATAAPAGLGVLQLLSALAVLAILLALALPAFQRSVDHLRADALRMQLVSLLSTARNTAIARSQRIEACPSSDGMTCGHDWSHGWLLYVAAAGGPPRPEGATPLRVEQLARSRLQALHSGGRPRIQFRPDGRNAGANQSIRICVEGRRHSDVVVSVPGRIRSRRVRRAMACDAHREKTESRDFSRLSAGSGARSWTRTNDPLINSQVL